MFCMATKRVMLPWLVLSKANPWKQKNREWVGFLYDANKIEKLYDIL